MTLVLDAGALIRLERGDRRMTKALTDELRRGFPPRTHGGVVGQVWRGGVRQARLAHALRGVEVVPLDDELGRRAGALLARATTSDVVDAAVALLADHGDTILTSDPDDLLPLVSLAARRATVSAV